jgi:hypothetical protein
VPVALWLVAQLLLFLLPLVVVLFLLVKLDASG